MRSSPTRPSREARALRSPLLALGLLIAWLVALFVLRAVLVDAAFSPYVRCDGCFFTPSLAHDAALAASAVALFGIALLMRARWLRALPLLLLGGAMLIAAADVMVFKTLTHRLLWSDVFKFVREIGDVGEIGARSLQGSASWVAGALAVTGIAAWLLCLRALPDRRGATVALVMAALLALGGGLARHGDPNYVNANLSFQNVLEVNLAQSIDAPYGAAFVAQMKALPPLAATCAPGQQRRPSVVLVMVESLSSYHSRRYGGALDAMPAVDALAEHGRWFADFHANGFTTDGGMIALFTGLAPIPVIGRYASMDAFAGYAERAQALPELLRDAGYDSAFFTTGDLGFVDKNRWLKDIGFDHFEGAESAFYAGRARGIFGAARDALLFDRFAEWYDARTDDRPFFAALLTVTTHPPFIDPESGVADEEGVFRQVDAAIAALHRHLAERGFFDDGILLVTGDHRAMTPLGADEYARHGERAFARVPLYAWGTGLGSGRVDGLFQHSDLLPSLADLTRSVSCRHAGQGLLLRDPMVPAAFVLHARGMPRDHIDVYTGRGDGAVILAGDRSRWEGEKPPEWESIAAAVHLQRASRASGEANLLDTLIDLRK
jgi:lipoteichoic acid synthase